MNHERNGRNGDLLMAQKKGNAMKKWFTTPNMIILAVLVIAILVLGVAFWDVWRHVTTPDELPEKWELCTVRSVEVGETEVEFQAFMRDTATNEEKVFHLKMDIDRYNNYRFGKGQLMFIMADQQAGYKYKLIVDRPYQPPVEEAAPETVDDPGAVNLLTA